jgi:hypothetical protein
MRPPIQRLLRAKTPSLPPSGHISSRQLAFVSGCFGFFLLLGSSKDLSAFSLNGYSWPPGTQVGMHLQLTGPPVALQDGSASWDASAADALANWNQYLDTVKFAQAGPVAASGGDGANSVFFSPTIYGDSFPSTALAVTLNYSSAGSGIFTETDVIFNNAIKWNSYRGPIQGTGATATYDFHRVALHEFGHVLGLDHPDQEGQGVYAIMNSFISDFDHLLEDDIDGAKFLYQFKFTSPLPLPNIQVGAPFTYQLSANNHPTSFTVTALPPGLHIDGTTGLISGTPTTTGTFLVGVTARGSRGEMTATIGFVIWPDIQKIGVPLAVFPVRATSLLNDPQRGRVYANAGDSIAVIDVQALSIIRTLPIAAYDISISADGSRLWMTTQRYLGPNASSFISSIDLDSFAAYPDIPVSAPAQYVREGANHQLFYTSAYGGFHKVDSVTGAASGPYRPRGDDTYLWIELTPDKSTLIAASRLSNFLARYDVAGETPTLLETTVQGGNSQQFALSHDGTKAWFQTTTADNYRTPSSRLYNAGDLSRTPTKLAVLGPGPSTFSPDDSLAYGENDFLTPAPANFIGQMHLYDPASGATLAKMDMPVPSGSLVVDSTNKYLFAAESSSYSGGEVNPLRAYAAFPALVHLPSASSKRFVNVSTRTFVETGDNVEIGGFIIRGNSPKRVVVRAIGPSLTAYGLPAMSDPTLELHDSTGAIIASNDNWASNQPEVESKFAPSDQHEAVIAGALAPGSYTAVVRGMSGGTGMALVELYDVDPTNSAIANISTRARVGAGDNVMIGGFFIGGEQPTRVVIRGIGPSLSRSSVADPLQDPILELHDQNGGILAQNDDWRTTQAEQLIDAGLAPTDDREAALIVSLQPGYYTAIVRGKSDSVGAGLVEVYNLDAN